jgi:hypothetical protein
MSLAISSGVKYCLVGPVASIEICNKSDSTQTLTSTVTTTTSTAVHWAWTVFSGGRAEPISLGSRRYQASTSTNDLSHTTDWDLPPVHLFLLEQSHKVYAVVYRRQHLSSLHPSQIQPLPPMALSSTSSQFSRIKQIETALMLSRTKQMLHGLGRLPRL